MALARLYEPDLVIVDCRFAPREAGKRPSGLRGIAYSACRLPRPEKDLSPITQHGGRHPLPDLDQLAKRLGQSGIQKSSRVVIYDDQGGAMASRLWWSLKYTGHEQAYVLMKALRLEERFVSGNG